MKKLLIANWKANPDAPGRAARLAKQIERGAARAKKTDVVIAPPFVFLSAVAPALRHAKLGAQDLFWEDTGPYTGEVSWHQLRHFRTAYAIIGHSERRRLVGETDGMVNKKILAALRAGIMPVLCIGESKETRRKGVAAAKRFVESQLKKDLAGVHARSLVVAYEPIWAIGTGIPDSPASAGDMIEFIRRFLAKRRIAARILYGGSVTAENARGFLDHKGIDGALVGGASLKEKEFNIIITIANHG